MSRGNRRTLVPVVLAAALLASMDAGAFSGCDSLFAATYPNSTTENLGSCQTCHSAVPSLNYYGIDLRAQANTNNVSACSQNGFPIAAAAVEGIDSDGEGSTNLEEINANTQPGWCDTNLAGCKGNNNGATPPGVTLDPTPTNRLPVADAGGPYSGEAGSTLIQFDGSGSSDPDGDTLTFEWEFGDGGTSTEMMPTHTYTKAGNFEVKLVVDDGQARSDPSITSAAISAPAANLAPVADPGGPYAAEPGQSITFDGSASADPNGDPLTYSWDFGDGSMGSGVNPTHSYAAEGTYTVVLTVTDDSQLNSDPATSTAEIAFAPANRAPTADPGGPYTGDTGVAIRFDGTGSSDPDGDALAYSWDFGDGSTGSGATPSHAYTMAGRYEVSLVVSDGALKSAAAVAAVEIVDLVAGQPDGKVLYDTNCAFCHDDP